MISNQSRKIPYLLEATSPSDIYAIHAATISVLSETGAIYDDPEAIRLLVNAGATVHDGGRVTIPSAMVEQAIKTAVEKFEPRLSDVNVRFQQQAFCIEARLVTDSQRPRVQYEVWLRGDGGFEVRG